MSKSIALIGLVRIGKFSPSILLILLRKLLVDLFLVALVLSVEFVAVSVCLLTVSIASLKGSATVLVVSTELVSSLSAVLFLSLLPALKSVKEKLPRSIMIDWSAGI